MEIPPVRWTSRPRALWRFDVGAAGLAVHWQPFYDGSNVISQRVRLLGEGQVVLSDDHHLAWLLVGGVGVELVERYDSASWSADLTGDAGLCLAFTGWRVPPLLCVVMNVGLTTGDIDVAPLVGLSF
jgi:hypothetical protein